MRTLNLNFVLLLISLVQLRHSLSEKLNAENVLPILPPNNTVVNISDTVVEQVESSSEASLTNVTVKGEAKVTVTKTSPSVSPVARIYALIKSSIRNIFGIPKINVVMRNIGTCVVNGVVELISYYFPAPLIPVIASIAGMIVPFEPVLNVRDQIPVSSYRRAFMTALNSFLGTFDRYKQPVNQMFLPANDPYMLQRFNRKMMNYGGEAFNPDQLPTKEPQDFAKETKPGFLLAIDKLFETLERLRKPAKESIEDPGRKFDWKKTKAGCTNC
ncbi:hypothetical protein O0L34_g18811 [Tuta absoluta]|nr:hypothetical protein O0L34_g18811 [Tuta absoluta]